MPHMPFSGDRQEVRWEHLKLLITEVNVRGRGLTVSTRTVGRARLGRSGKKRREEEGVGV